ncbi:MAG: DUF4446 family protein [Firmicutes bacterium]|nr:DUF4446 family protein [Bacillota bacterium]HXL04519.1 DUF4446 family protein [Bacillota bacterium]
MEVLNSIGDAISVLMKDPMYILTILFAAATVLFFILNIQISRVLKTYRNLLHGVRGGNLEEVIRENVEHMGIMERKMESLEAFIEDVHSISKRHLQGVGIVRFNAFEDIGGNQSFAVALLDGKGDGIVLSSLYGRDESRVYAKPVKGGLSEYALSSEEEMAVEQALMPAR